MLFINRRLGEALIIDHKTEVIIDRIEGNRVRLGIQAPKEISIDRKELFAYMQQKKEGKLPPG